MLAEPDREWAFGPRPHVQTLYRTLPLPSGEGWGESENSPGGQNGQA